MPHPTDFTSFSGGEGLVWTDIHSTDTGKTEQYWKIHTSKQLKKQTN